MSDMPKVDYMLTMPDGTQVLIEGKDRDEVKAEADKRIKDYYAKLEKN